VREHAAGHVFSVEKVGDELEAERDALATWAQARGNGFFLPPDARTLPALDRVSAWGSSQSYAPAAVNGFLQVADYYLVAQALALGNTVVTHEAPDPQSIRKTKIPEARRKLKRPFPLAALQLRWSGNTSYVNYAPYPGENKRDSS
jgi:hypothetical protein